MREEGKDNKKKIWNKKKQRDRETWRVNKSEDENADSIFIKLTCNQFNQFIEQSLHNLDTLVI